MLRMRHIQTKGGIFYQNILPSESFVFLETVKQHAIFVLTEKDS